VLESPVNEANSNAVKSNLEWQAWGANDPLFAQSPARICKFLLAGRHVFGIEPALDKNLD